MGSLARRDRPGGPARRPWLRRRAGGGGRGSGWRLAVPVVCAGAGLLASTSMINAQGTDLRGGRNVDLVGIVSSQREQATDLQQRSQTLQQQVEHLTHSVSGNAVEALNRRLQRLETPAGLTRLTGPGLVVTLNDAPVGQPIASEVDPNLLVVHQQDIQAVVNALFTGGAEGVSLQGQRIVTTTGIKCVGNTVVLQGVPYSPPYRIEAVGDPTRLYDALVASPEVAAYRDYVAPPYNLGWSLRSQSRLSIPAFAGPVRLDYAHPSS